MNVANAIGAEFSLAEQASIEKIPTDSSAAYALYLRASSIFSEDFTASGVTRNRSRWEPLLLDAIDLDPDFALAYELLAFVYATMFEEVLSLEYAEKALELDPELGSAYAAMASMYRSIGRFDEALEFSEKGVQLSPADPVVLGGYAGSLVAAGRGEESLRVLDRLIELDPAGAVNFFSVSFIRWRAGDRDGGLVAMRRSVELRSARYSRMILGMMEFTLGNRAEGVTQVQLAHPLTSDDLLLLPHQAYSYRVVGLPDDAVRIARTWIASDEEGPPGVQSLVQSFYYHLVLDEEEQALDALVRLIENPGVFGTPPVLAMTNMFDDPTLEKPEFAALLAELRAKVGWN
jgi:tetratricopeptide (TPR) repeat protein